MSEPEHILKPAVAYLKSCGRLLLDTDDMATFLGIPAKAVRYMTWTTRLPLPMRLGGLVRWNVIHLLPWVEAGCPR